MQLRVEVGGRLLTFDDSRPLRMGRGSDGDVVLPAMSVSRLHAELRPTPQGWLLVDTGGQLGTFVDGVRVGERLIAAGSTATVRLGPSAPGSTVEVRVELPAGGDPETTVIPAVGASSRSSYADDEHSLGGDFDQTAVLASPWRSQPGGETRARTGPDLMIDVEGEEHRFGHPETVTVGRRSDSSVVLTDRVASRVHLRVEAVEGAWAVTNLSSEGTFHEGRPIGSRTFDEALTLRLGHPSAGTELQLLPVYSTQEELARMARRRRSRRLALAGSAFGALLLVGALVVGTVALVTGGPGGTRPAAENYLTAAKAKTVRISYEVTTYDGRTGTVTGSGSIIDPRGLILTNAHIASPHEPGLSDLYEDDGDDFPDPDHLDVSLTDPDDDFRTGAPQYRARVVEADGDRDAAVIQIYADADGTPIDPDTLDLPSYELGDSGALATGDSVTVLGFPGIARATDVDPETDRPEVSVTTGVISTFIDTARLGPRSEIDTDARISQGNSGGSAIDTRGRLIGVPSSTFRSEGSAGVSGRIRPLAVLDDLIASATTEAFAS